MTTPTATLERAGHAATEKLAIHGGAPCVQNPPQEKWPRLSELGKQKVIELMEAGISTVVGSGSIVSEFESAFAKMVGTKYALTMTNGTAALHSAYFAVGVGPGDEVIVPTYTWHATITPILHCAAKPVFCDIDASTLTIDPDDIERKITPRTKAICVVHVFGNVCDMGRITAIAKKHGIALIEDCSHAHGATWNGQKVGSFGEIGCFSLQGGKPVSGGECGIATTNSAELMDRMILLGHFGRAKFDTNEAITEVGDMTLGAKYRAHAYAVALAWGDLQRLPELNERRTRNYKILNDCVRDCAGLEIIEPLPGAKRGGYLEFKFKLSPEVLAITDRNTIVEAMEAEGAPVTADRYSDFNYTYGLLHTAPLFRRFDLHSVGGCFYDPSLSAEEENALREIPSLPVAEDLARRLITVPAYTDVPEESIVQIGKAMCKVLSSVASL
jgi:dTDP-4-amino-4,6-dideoxygalactose transaminase